MEDLYLFQGFLVLKRFIGKLEATAQATILDKLQVRYLQCLKIQACRFCSKYQAKLSLDRQAQHKIFWWINNVTIYTRKFQMLPPLDLFMRHIPQPRNGEHLTPCSNLALGVNHHKTFKSIQYDLKLFFLKKIMITSEYLHNRLNLVLRSFQKRVEVLSVSVPDDLLEFRDPRHRPMCVPNIQPGSYYKTWKLNQRTQNKDAFQKIMLQHAFLPFSLILLLLTKLKKGKER